jgi:hypothetical protein
MGQLFLRFEIALRACSLINFHTCPVETSAEAATLSEKEDMMFRFAH